MNLRTCVFGCALSLIASAGTAQTLTLQPLGGPQEPISLSASGSRGVRPHEFFWDFPDVYTALPDSADGVRSSPDGQWALGRNTVTGVAARYGRNGGFEPFPNATNGLVPNTAFAAASGNSVVVGYGLDAGGQRHGFIWRIGSGTQDTGVLLGDRSSSLVDVSSGGSTAVGYGEPTTSGNRHPLIYTSQGYAKLSRSGGGFLDGGEAKAISGDGLVVVGTRTLGSTLRAFRWTQSGAEIDLASPSNPGSLTLQTIANDVSANGAWTVGESATSGGGSVVATMWNAAGTPFLLSDLLGSEPTHQFLELRSISSISDDGMTVSGTCFDTTSGQLRAFVATLTPSNPGGCAPDLGSAGGESGQDGQLDNNDFIVFIDDFFASNITADFGSAGGVSGADGTFDNNDFIAFINSFFNGCN